VYEYVLERELEGNGTASFTSFFDNALLAAGIGAALDRFHEARPRFEQLRTARR
jgi:hypothetical protein